MTFAEVPSTDSEVRHRLVAKLDHHILYDVQLSTRHLHHITYGSSHAH